MSLMFELHLLFHVVDQLLKVSTSIMWSTDPVKNITSTYYNVPNNMDTVNLL